MFSIRAPYDEGGFMNPISIKLSYPDNKKKWRQELISIFVCLVCLSGLIMGVLGLCYFSEIFRDYSY